MIPAEGHELFQRMTAPLAQCVLTTHVQPDGDAIGSEIGLASFLADRGTRVRIVNGDPTPPNLGFLGLAGVPIEVYAPERHDDVLARAELVLLLDNSAPDRLGRMESVMHAVADHTLCIDHHPGRETRWAHQIIDDASCATAVMIFELTRRCGWTPPREAAEALYVGLATDTGFFRFNSTSALAHSAAAELLRLGAHPARAYQEIFEHNSVAYTRLLGHALAGLRLDAGGAVASVRITRALVTELAAADVDTSEMTTPILATGGVQVALLFRELEGGRVKVSLRSKGLVDVHRLAAEFGGGGHRNASGIVMSAALDDAVERVIARATEYLAR
jgi:phosphoesterase RecJ-like protein